MTRYYKLDNIKAIGIFLVVFAHHTSILEGYVYSFHMPLFFFISGYLFNNKKYEFKDFVTRRLKSLMIPYFSFALILYIFWFFFGRKFGMSAEMNLSPVTNFIGIFYAQGRENFMDWGIPMWFIPCLFLTYVVFYQLARLNTKIMGFVLILCSAIGYVTTLFPDFRIPWSINVLFTAIVFYGLGYMLRPRIEQFKINPTNIGLLLVLLAISIGAYTMNGKIDMHENKINNFFLFYLSAISGTLFYFLVISLLPQSKILSYIGINSIIILAFHLRAMTIIKAILIFVFKIEASDNNLLIVFIYSLVQILLLLPIIFIINRYTPFLLGKRLKTNIKNLTK